ncbi:hypothetical protein NBRC116583_16190 [Arenicella sp. 4NH20-0111]|uniref:MNIO family bufferin maturase n=1 Tax=Arenicella sp. 4NH20-0111 TaxID=3127648 RepID=UPI0031079E04
MNCGLGIRPELFEKVFAERPELGFLEAHSENYFGDSLVKETLLELRDHYPISLHGVGLSLGRADELDKQHLASLSSLVAEVRPFIVSEHLAWSAYSHRHVPDLLPLPLTSQALSIMCDHIDQMQQALGRQILIENPSNYLVFDALQIPEPDFLNQLADKTGCGLLVDINNIHVSAVNVGRDPVAYLSALSTDAIKQYHLAGYTEVTRDLEGVSETLLIDTHDHPVHEPVWRLFEKAMAIHGAVPTLFEWDSDFPEFDVLIGECEKADNRIRAARPINIKSVAKLDDDSGRSDKHSLGPFQDRFLNDVFSLSDNHDQVIAGQKHRIGVYQNNLFGAIQDYLAEVYPATRGVVGQDFFKQMVQVSVQKYPPSIGDLHRYGKELRFVIEYFESLADLPYLQDLMRFEWALHFAYYSKVILPLDPRSVPQEDLLSLPVELDLSVTVCESEYPIWEIHRQSLPSYSGQVEVTLDQSSDTILIFKRDSVVQAEIISDELANTLAQIRKSENLMQAIDALAGSIDSNDVSANLGFVFENTLLCRTVE